MQINSNSQSNSLQGLSSQFLRIQKQRQAAREQGVQNAEANTQSFAAIRTAQKAVVTEPKAQVVPEAQNTPVKTAPVAPATVDTVSLSSNALAAQKVAAAAPTTGVAAESVNVKPKTETQDAATLSTATQSNATPPTFTQKDVEEFQNSFGAVTGDDRFNATYDLDGNGSINTLDLVRLLGRIG